MPYWRDAWVHEWEVFRRHLVQLHYDELAHWTYAAGVPRARIWSSQGLMPPAEGAMPFARRVTSPVKNHDSGGVSVEGSKPRDGHLGAILYGAAAGNDVPMENGRRLFATLAAVDPGFAIVEFNTADLRRPNVTPDYAAAYRALRDAWNAGARFVSPMAWNGANGTDADAPGYAAYTAWRNTPLEEAAKDFLLARAGLAPGTRLWTFGSPQHADGDGWIAEHGEAVPRPGHLALRAGADGIVTLLSPDDLALAAAKALTLVLGLPRTAAVRGVTLFVRNRVASGAGTADGAWALRAAAERDALRWCDAGLVVPLPPQHDGIHARLRIRIAFEAGASASLARIALIHPTLA
jgi:hypothetical protein